jgi:oligopeptide/dipeptide ABC transporter ATP-binding protein
MPSPARPPSGCPFHTRCPIAKDICRVEVPKLEPKSSGARVACHLVS